MADVTIAYLREVGVFDRAEAALAATPPGGTQASSSTKSGKPTPENGASVKETKGEAAKQAKQPKQPKQAKNEAKTAPAPQDGPPPAELSKEQLAKLTKEERTAYHLARRNAAPQAAASKQQLSKADRKQLQESQRKAKEDLKAAAEENEELYKELKLQGLPEDQAREMMKEMLKGKDEEEKEKAAEEEEEALDFLSCVKSWMAASDKQLPENPLSDFNLKVRFQGHVDTTPPDHITAVLHIIAQQGCAECDLNAKTQPTAVARKLEPIMKKWAAIMKPLFKKIDDPLTGPDAVMRGIQEGVATLVSVPEAGRGCGVVGCLMALREIDMIEDEDLLTACKRADPMPKVMEKFIEFLEAELDDEDEEDSDED